MRRLKLVKKSAAPKRVKKTLGTRAMRAKRLADLKEASFRLAMAREEAA